MFGKKQSPPPGRQRPPSTADRRNAAVFSYHSASARSARIAGGTGRDAAAAAAASAQAQREASQRHAANALRLGKLPLRILLFVVGLFLLSSLYVSSEPALVIETDNAGEPTLLRDQQLYEQAAAQLIGGSPFNHVKPLLNTGRIASELDKQFPELGDVSVALPAFGHRLEIHTQPAIPALIMSNNTGQSFVLDTNGRALMPSTQAPGVGKLGLPVVTDQSGITLRAGEASVPSSTARFITEVAGQLKAANLTISSLTLPKGTSELDVRLEGQPYTVKFNLMANGRVEAGSFLAVKQQLERDKKTPSNYVDVRVDGRAYYK